MYVIHGPIFQRECWLNVLLIVSKQYWVWVDSMKFLLQFNIHSFIIMKSKLNGMAADFQIL